jgi:hypothetical protein
MRNREKRGRIRKEEKGHKNHQDSGFKYGQVICKTFPLIPPHK